MKIMTHNRLGILLLSIAIFCAALVGSVMTRQDADVIVVVIGLTIFLLDAGCRLRLYQASHDKFLLFLSDQDGGQVACLPLWLWGYVMIIARLTHAPLLLTFSIALGLADVTYRLRVADFEARSRLQELFRQDSFVPPLWVLASFLCVLSLWRLIGLETRYIPRAETLFRAIVLTLYLLLMLVRGYYAQKMRHYGVSDASEQRVSQEYEGMLRAGILRGVFSAMWVVILLYSFAPRGLAWFALAYPEWVRWFGVVCGVGSLALLIWVHQTLGIHWSRQLRMHDPHTLVTHGPYHWVRHPMYTVLCGFYLGTMLAAANGFILVVNLGAIVALCARITTEEQMMLDYFGDAYRVYMQHTGRLFPRFR
ncbi:MAG: isoprenylcysteine carboxylmethyltransferase family protein [Candidatus Tectomicrobia bacterium]